MTTAKRWHVEIFLDEHDDERRTRAEARLHAGENTHLIGVGTAHRNPTDVQEPDSAEADRRGGSVQAVTAWQWTEPGLGTEIRSEHERMARLSLDDTIALARRGHPDIPVAAEATAGSAAEVLTRAATDADLLVLGS